MIEKPLFLLLRLGLQTRLPEQEDLSCLRTMSENQWESLLEMARHQGVPGLAYEGVRLLVERYGTSFFDHFENRSWWRRFIVPWAVSVESAIETGNEKQRATIAHISDYWAEKGIRMMLFKGMAIATLYPNPSLRDPGDIDCYLFGDYDRGNQTARMLPAKVDESWYKHSTIYFEGQSIENHQFFIHTREGKSSRTFNQLLCDSLTDIPPVYLDGTKALLAPPAFNALFLTNHAMTHFLEEGLLLKQLADWAMFLQAYGDEIDWNAFNGICKKYHMDIFASVATDIAVHHFGVPLPSGVLTDRSPFTEKVLHSTLYDEDYVFSSGGTKWQNRIHLIKNLFRYRWKYHQIYRHSILRQLSFYLLGYLFKVEG